jgi:hypothetical protein
MKPKKKFTIGRITVYADTLEEAEEMADQLMWDDMRIQEEMDQDFEATEEYYAEE